MSDPACCARRFDRQVVVPNPDVMGREKFKVHMRKTPLADGVEPRVIARGTPGFPLIWLIW